jgi:hypothetical protein
MRVRSARDGASGKSLTQTACRFAPFGAWRSPRTGPASMPSSWPGSVPPSPNATPPAKSAQPGLTGSRRGAGRHGIPPLDARPRGGRGGGAGSGDSGATVGRRAGERRGRRPARGSGRRDGAGLPPFELTEVTTTAPTGFQPEPPPPRVAEHIEYADRSHWRDESVITEPFHDGTQMNTQIRNGPWIATVAGGRVTRTRAVSRSEVPFAAVQGTALRKLAAAGSSGRCAPSVSLGGNGPLIDGRPTLILRVGPSPCPSAAVPEANGPATYWLDKQTLLILRAVLHGPGNRISQIINVTGLRYHVTFPAGTFRLPRPASKPPRPPACRAATSLPDLAALRHALASPPLLPAHLPGRLRIGAIAAEPNASGATTSRCKINAFTVTYRDPTAIPPSSCTKRRGQAPPSSCTKRRGQAPPSGSRDGPSPSARA